DAKCRAACRPVCAFERCLGVQGAIACSRNASRVRQARLPQWKKNHGAPVFAERSGPCVEWWQQQAQVQQQRGAQCFSVDMAVLLYARPLMLRSLVTTYRNALGT